MRSRSRACRHASGGWLQVRHLFRVERPRIDGDSAAGGDTSCGPFSPLIAAIYLKPLDERLEATGLFRDAAGVSNRGLHITDSRN